MKHPIVLLFSFWMMAACCSDPDKKLDPYLGSRDSESLKEEIQNRYGFHSLLASGSAQIRFLKEDGNEKEHQFNFEMLLDRKIKAFRMAGDKVLTGTLFTFSTLPKSHILVDSMADEGPLGFRLSLNDRLNTFGDLTLEKLRSLLLDSWPPSENPHRSSENPEHLLWGSWKFDWESLTLLDCSLEGVVWKFMGWKPAFPGPFWASTWLIETPSGSLTLSFDEGLDWDNSWSEEDFRLDLTGVIFRP